MEKLKLKINRRNNKNRRSRRIEILKYKTRRNCRMCEKLRRPKCFEKIIKTKEQKGLDKLKLKMIINK